MPSEKEENSIQLKCHKFIIILIQNILQMDGMGMSKIEANVCV